MARILHLSVEGKYLMLNPLKFKTIEDFQKAQEEERRGWGWKRKDANLTPEELASLNKQAKEQLNPPEGR